jgi:hypothetical protein
MTETKKGVAISSRWAPGHRINIDTEAGTYEELNAPLLNAGEASVQTALLARNRPKKATGYPLLWWLSICGVAMGSMALIIRTAQLQGQ